MKTQNNHLQSLTSFFTNNQANIYMQLRPTKLNQEYIATFGG